MKPCKQYVHPYVYPYCGTHKIHITIKPHELTTKNSHLIFLSLLQATNKCAMKNEVEVEVFCWEQIGEMFHIVMSIFVEFDSYVEHLPTSYCEYI